MAHTTSDSEELISSINVTPLVDVVLVILIIFIMTASIIFRNGIPLELPQAQSSQQASAGLLNVGISRDGQVFINGQPRQLGEIAAVVAEARSRQAKGDGPLSAFVSADVKAGYGMFARVVDRLRMAGISSIALDTQPEDLAEKTK